MKRVTLSFDNGPTVGVTDRVLDLLAERGLTAWFFVLGNRLRAGRALVERARREGHLIGNHTLTHTIPLGERSGPDAVDEIATTESLLGDLACPAPVFRPFGRGGAIGTHLLNAESVGHLCEHGYTVALWNNVPGDWHDERWVEKCLATADSQDWSVVVLHDTNGACLDRLAEFLDALKARDVEFSLELPPSVTPIVAGRVIAPSPDWMPDAVLA